jgi:hypothetical protein
LVPLHTNALNLFIQHPFNLRHIVVKNGLQAAIIPLYCYAHPIRFSDSANITGRGSPTNAVAYFEQSGLVAGHLRFTLGGSTSSTRLISLWLVKLLWPSRHFMMTYLASIEVTLPLSSGSPLKQTRVPTFNSLDCSGVIS